MNFEIVDCRIPSKELEQAHRQWLRTTVELGVRKNNNHVGSGLGGDNFQLLVLMGMKHFISASPDVKIIAGGDEITLGSAWLASSDVKTIRQELDKVFPNILEGRKYQALVLEAVAKSGNLRDTLNEYKEHFPQLINWMRNDGRPFNWGMSNLDMLIWAYIQCQDLANDLDSGIETRVTAVGQELSWMHAEIILLSVRKFIQIDRIIHFNLDEHPTWKHVLNKVNQLVS